MGKIMTEKDKEKKKDLEAQLGRAVMAQATMTKALNRQNALCNQLATKIEGFNGK